MRGSSELHSLCVDELLIFLSEFGTFWKNPTGVGKCLMTGNVVKYGLTGSTDIVGWLRDGHARFCGFEVKTGRAVQAPLQKSFERVLRQDGGLYFLVRYNPPDYLHELRAQLLREIDKPSYDLSM